MEQRGEDRDAGIPNSRVNYNPPQITQESPVKLPLAPILSTPQDRRANATVSTRRGISIFSPTQTLDYHHHHHRLSVNPPPLLPPQLPKDPTPDPDPNTTTPASPPQRQAPPPPQPPSPPPPPPPPASSSSNNNTGIRYRECLKNHAASMGSHVVDGCGEFMASGEEGTAEAMRCAACDCHRNFHRKEVEGDAPPSTERPKHAGHYGPPRMVNFGGDESSSEELMNNSMLFHSSDDAAMQSGSKKRFRTKFSDEQKERMQELAEKIGWRIQKQDEEQVQQFCNESGVKRQVFKVWMHNNKQALKKRQSAGLS